MLKDLQFCYLDNSYHFITYFMYSYQVEKPFGFKINSNMRGHSINRSYMKDDFEKLEMSEAAPQVIDSINDDDGKV